MRILHLIPSLSGGGAERQLSYLAPKLASQGHDVHIAYTSEGPQRPSLAGVHLHRLSVRSNHDPSLFYQVIRVIDRVQPEVVHTWIAQMDIVGGMAAKLRRTPWVFRESSAPQAYPATWKNRLRVLLGLRADAVVSNSATGDAYWARFVPAARRHIARNAIDLGEIRNCADFDVGLVSNEQPVIVYVGRLIPSKNLRVLLSAIAILRASVPVNTMIVGDGPSRGELENLARELGLTDDLTLLGYLRSEIAWGLMRKSSVFVSLSSFEGCPNAVMEAIACECPLVLSDISAHRELVDDFSALLVDHSNPRAVASALASAIEDSGLARQRAEIAADRLKDWSIDNLAKHWTAIYTGVIDRRLMNLKPTS